jgi:hypothetical protein
LLLFRLFEVADVLFSSVGGPSGDCNFTLHDLIVFFDLLEGSIELIELFLGFEYSLELLISLFFLAFVLSLQDLILSLCFDSVSLDNVIVVVGALECGLHPGELMLDSVELHTSLFS